MGRGLLNLIIDTVAAALLTAMVGTGYILWFVLPPGTNRTHILWGVLRHQWGAVHFWMSVMLLTVLAVHVALHWRWLVMGLSRRFGVAAWAERSPRLAGLTLVAAAALPLTMLALAAHVSVRPMDIPLHPLVDERRPGMPPTALESAAERTGQPSSVSTAPSPTGPIPSTSIPLTSQDISADTRDAVIARAAAVLAERCAGCHGVHAPSAGIRADTLDALREAQGGIHWVTPGRPDESPLFEAVGVRFEARRIASMHRLNQSEVDALRAWIAILNE